MTKPPVTIIVPPRDRFSYARRSLESLYRNTDYPFELVYVDGNSPDHVRRYVQREANSRHFRLIRTEHYLSPNQARNLGLRDVRTQYVVFLDNDVDVAPGWLTHLVACAEETGASAVTPLVFEGTLEEEIIHTFGGRADFTDDGGVRTFQRITCSINGHSTRCNPRCGER